jgi:hypothetical protein
MGLEPDQPLDVVTAREAGHRMATMLVNARTKSLVTPI